MRLSGLPDLQTGCKPVARARRVKRRPPGEERRVG